VEYVRGRILYVVLKGGWCTIIILNLQAPIVDKIFNSKNSSCNELQQIFNYIPENCENLLRDFDDNLDREDFSNWCLGGNENVHESGNDNGVKIVMSARQNI